MNKKRKTLSVIIFALMLLKSAEIERTKKIYKKKEGKNYV